MLAALDLVAHTSTFPHRPSRQVQKKEGEKLAQELDAAHIETSAKENINVGAYAFLALLRRAYCAPVLAASAEISHASLQLKCLSSALRKLRNGR